MIFPRSHGMNAAGLGAQVLGPGDSDSYCLLKPPKTCSVNFQFNCNFVLFIARETYGFCSHSKNPKNRGKLSTSLIFLAPLPKAYDVYQDHSPRM